MPTLLDPEHVAALMSPGVDADDLTLVIEREEHWLANDPVDGIGQLVGERVDTMWVTPGDTRPLLLRRPVASVEAVDGGVALAADTIRLLGGTRVEPVGAWRGPSVQRPPRRSTSRRSNASCSSCPSRPLGEATRRSPRRPPARPTDPEQTRSRLARSLAASRR
jgi:hypothetical protein